MIKKLMAFSFFICAFNSHANASVLEEIAIRNDLVHLAKYENHTAKERTYARMIYSDSAARKIMAVWSSYNYQEEYGEKWGEVGLNLLRWSYPEKPYEWNTATRFSGVSHNIYQQNTLFDLDRVQLSETDYPIVDFNGFETYNTLKPERTISSTSKRRMVEGKSPIGPDNKPILVCRIGPSSEAPYVEISSWQKDRFEERTGMNFDRCLFGNTESKYWQHRISDFIDKVHERTSSHAPGRQG